MNVKDNRIYATYKPIATVFGSSTCQPGSPLYELAYEVGKKLANYGYSVANGGYTGTMDATAKGAKDTEGRAIGITTQEINKVVPSPYLVELFEEQTLNDRLETLIQLGDIYVYLPGSTGTLTELALALDKQKLGLVPIKPNILVGETWHEIFELLFVRTNPLVPKSSWKKDTEVQKSTFLVHEITQLDGILEKITS